MVNVGKYTIHGSYGLEERKAMKNILKKNAPKFRKALPFVSGPDV